MTYIFYLYILATKNLVNTIHWMKSCVINCDLWVEWLKQQGLCHYDENNNFIMVHAGVAQMVPKDILNYNEEIKKLKNNDINYYISNMYGNSPTTWDERLEGTDGVLQISLLSKNL